jgi:hypothetical protein
MSKSETNYFHFLFQFYFIFYIGDMSALGQDINKFENLQLSSNCR